MVELPIYGLTRAWQQSIVFGAITQKWRDKMPIKQRNAITKADFEEALDYLGSSVSEVAKQTNIPRAYLSDLKNRNVRLRREHEDKLREYLVGQGVEFDGDTPTEHLRGEHASLDALFERFKAELIESGLVETPKEKSSEGDAAGRHWLD